MYTHKPPLSFTETYYTETKLIILILLFLTPLILYLP